VHPIESFLISLLNLLAYFPRPNSTPAENALKLTPTEML
jgi:hypothetical protein